ncbi:ATP-binding protein [Streptomyces rubiginosohelvolus]|uniref:ATP-binding protein n=1 Tax=Streptomyces rubiginosohelvolus TaxID=67362 RepID=UPI00341047F4
MIVSVDDYFTGDEAFAAKIREQVQVVTGWLADPALDSGRRFETAQAKLGSAEDLRTFLVKQELTRPEWDQAVVVYITGHGLRGPSGRHYLTFGDTSSGRLLGTAFPTSELVTQVLDSEAEHVLVLVDSCFAGSLDSELRKLLEDLSIARRGLKTLAVVVSGDFHESPRVGEFTELLSKALAKAGDESAGFTASHLTFEEWDSLLRTVGRENPGLIEAVWAWPRTRDDVPSLCLPNPHFVAEEQVVQASRQPLALSAPALDQYWLNRASGRTGESDPGWYFSGRQALMRQLVEFVADGEGVLAVTGAAGSGKSALLARLVTFSDPLFAVESRFADVVSAVAEELRPGLGSVDAAVVARGKSSLELLQDLLSAFGAAVSSAPPLQALLTLLGDTGIRLARPVTVVVDGVDEAQQPRSVLSDVLVPLARLKGADGSAAVRLVLGMRSSALGAGDGKLRDAAADQLLDVLHTLLQANAVEQEVPLARMRTDGPGAVGDITAYVQALLQMPESSPYHGLEDAAGQAADIIARAVEPSFLDARLAAAQLRSAPAVQDTDEKAWRERLLEGTLALFSSDLRQVALDQSVRIDVLLAVLRATAFAQGAGLPWAEVWPAVASAVLGTGAPGAQELDDVIRTVRHSRLVGYLVTGQEDGRVTYRPSHQRLTEVLLRNPADLAYGPDKETAADWADAVEKMPGLAQGHRAIAEACAELARRAVPGAPHPYVRRYTVAHADAGGVLDDSIMPVSLAARESSGTVRARLGLPLPVEDGKRRVLAAAGLIEPFIDESVDVVSRLSSVRFQLAACNHGERQDDITEGSAAGRGAGLRAGPGTVPVRVRWRPRADVVASPDSHVFTLCALTTAEGRGLITAGTRRGIRVWDASSGQNVVQIDTGLTWDLSAIKATSGRSFLVAGGQKGAGVFDPLSGRELASLQIANAHHVQVLHDGLSRWQVAVENAYSTVRWRPSEGVSEEIGAVASRGLKTVAWLRSPAGHMVRLLRDRAEFMLHDPVTGRSTPVALPSAVSLRIEAAPGPDGHDLLAVMRQNRVDLFDPFEGKVRGNLPGRANGAVILTLQDGHRVLGLRSLGSVTVWDTAADAPLELARFDCPSGSRITAVTMQDGSWGLAATSDAGIVLLRAQDVAPAHPSPAVRGESPSQVSTVVSEADGRQWLVVAQDGGVSLVDPVSGQRLEYLECPPPVRCVAEVPDLGNGPAVAVAHGQGVVLWQPRIKLVEKISGTPMWGAMLLGARLNSGQPALFIAHGTALWGHDLLTGKHWFLQPSTQDKITNLAAYPSPTACVQVIGVTKRHMSIWNAADGSTGTRARLTPPAGRGACVVPVAGDAPVLAVASGKEVTLYTPGTWKPVGRIDTPLTTAIIPVRQDDGTWLVATGNGTGLRLWEPSSGELVHCVLTAAPVTHITQTTGPDNMLHISGPAGHASVQWNFGHGVP